MTDAVQSDDWVQMAPGVRRRVVADGERMMLAEFQISVGAAVNPHQHMHEQLSRVISGRGVYTIGGARIDAGPGDTLLIPGDVLHSFSATEDSFLIDVFSPPRAEFRK